MSSLKEKKRKRQKKKTLSTSLNSTVATKGECVVSLPVCPARRPTFVVQVSLAMQTPVFLPSRSKTAELPVLMDWIAEPVDSWIISDSIVSNINQDYLIVLVSRILC